MKFSYFLECISINNRNVLLDYSDDYIYDSIYKDGYDNYYIIVDSDEFAMETNTYDIYEVTKDDRLMYNTLYYNLMQDINDDYEKVDIILELNIEKIREL